MQRAELGSLRRRLLLSRVRQADLTVDALSRLPEQAFAKARHSSASSRSRQAQPVRTRFQHAAGVDRLFLANPTLSCVLGLSAALLFH